MRDDRWTESLLPGSPPLEGIAAPPVPIAPETKVFKIGGQSILDRGRRAVFPLVDEMVAARDDHHLLVCCGGGTRARHIYSIASDLELPTGVLATLGGQVPMQNARMLQMVMAKHGAIYVEADDFAKMPLYFRLGVIPIMSGMSPFGYWEKSVEVGRIPAHRTDAGVFLTAEALGVPRVIFIKDEDGLFEDDPKKDPSAKRIPRISSRELAELDLPDVAIERIVIEYLGRSRFCKEVQIVNGLEAGMLTRALAGEDVGSIIYQEDHD